MQEYAGHLLEVYQLRATCMVVVSNMHFTKGKSVCSTILFRERGKESKLAGLAVEIAS
jgi:hypothetical protein